MFREQSSVPLDDDDDDDGGFGAPQDDYGSTMHVDDDGAGPVPEEDFFAGNDPMDTFEDTAMSPEGVDDGATPSFDNDQFHAGPGGEQGEGTGNANGPYGPFDPRRMRTESDRIIAMTEGDGQGGMIELFDQTFLKNWAGPEHWKLRRVVKRRMYLQGMCQIFSSRLTGISLGSRAECGRLCKDEERQEGSF